MQMNHKGSQAYFIQFKREYDLLDKNHIFKTKRKSSHFRFLSLFKNHIFLPTKKKDK